MTSMSDLIGGGSVVSHDAQTGRTEKDVVNALDPEAQALLKRVLEIERSRLHLKGSDAGAVDDLYEAVRGIIP